MRARWLGALSPLLVATLVGCTDDPGVLTPVDGGRPRADGGAAEGGTIPVDSGGPGPCIDGDGDGIADNLENGDSDMDGTPDAMDMDSDGDGFTDADEAVGNYPRAMPSPPLMCGRSPNDCDGDARPNFRDLDSDNDGLTDAEERMAGTNACSEDSDGDGVPDLTERVAMSNPADPGSMPPSGSLYVTLPYHPPPEMGPHVLRRFTFQTRIRAADVMFVVDTTGSMGPTIAGVQSTLMSTIIPGIVSAIGMDGNLRYGLAGHGDFGIGGGNYTGNVQVFQRLTRDAAAVQAATRMLRADNGGDYPESQVPAMHALISGVGFPTYGGTAVRNVDPIRDCMMAPDEPESYGWACFQVGRVPIMVLLSDAEWHNRPGVPNEYGGMVPTYADLQREMMRRGAYFIGIDVGRGDTFRNSQVLARATMTLNGMGQPIAFMGTASAVASQVVSAITTIAGQSRQDITTRTDPDPMEMRLPPMRTTAEFVREVVPFAAVPDMPAGYERKDRTTFYNVSPDARVEFEVDFYNDFQPGGVTATLYRATIVVLGRARSEVDRRDVYIIVPSNSAQPPIG
jgi:hypothetical protein